MQLSRGWWKMLLSWAAAVSLCVISGGIFHFIVPVSQEDAAAVEQYALPAAPQNVGNHLGTAPAVQPDTSRLLADNTRSLPPVLVAQEAVPAGREAAIGAPVSAN